MTTTTILFTDVSHSTETLRASGDEVGARAMADHLRACRAVIEHHGGRVSKTLGDGVMALFDTASAAVRAAVALQQDNDSRGRAGKGSFGLRVGVHVGDVVDAAIVDEPDILGTAVVVARRLCDTAETGQVVVSEVVRLLVGDNGGVALDPLGTRFLKGLGEPTTVHAAAWEPLPGDTPLRVVIAEDSSLVRAGLVRLLRDEGFDVVAEVADHDALLAAVRAHVPDLVVTDIRMPPMHADEGLRAAAVIRSELPAVAVLVLSQHVEVAAARTLLATNPTSVGYLLKERVAEVDEFLDACRAVAAGASVIDPLVIDPPRRPG